MTQSTRRNRSMIAPLFLFEAIKGVPDEALSLPGTVGTWSALDVLAHIKNELGTRFLTCLE